MYTIQNIYGIAGTGADLPILLKKIMVLVSHTLFMTCTLLHKTIISTVLT